MRVPARSSRRVRDLLASVRGSELVLRDGDGQRSLPLPDDRFYLSGGEAVIGSGQDDPT